MIAQRQIWTLGEKTWSMEVVTETLMKKLDVYARACYRIMLGNRQSNAHMKYEEKCAQCSIRELVRECQLQFIDHSLRIDKEEIYALYKSEVRKTQLEDQKRHKAKSQNM